MESHSYKTLSKPVEGTLIKERKSKFVGYAYPVSDESGIEGRLSDLRAAHPKANHLCYAWQLRTEPVSWRANDDGEPNNSAGMPIYGQIQAFGLTDVLVAVVRYFGGTKLGVGGLISAYKNSAQQTLDRASIETVVPRKNIEITFTYPHMHSVMRIVKKYDLEISGQEDGQRVRYSLGVPVNRFQKVLRQFRESKGVEVKVPDA